MSRKPPRHESDEEVLESLRSIATAHGVPPHEVEALVRDVVLTSLVALWDTDDRREWLEGAMRMASKSVVSARQ